MECTPFNVFCGKSSLVGVSICLLVNGKACLKMELNENGQARFENKSCYPDPGQLEGLPLRRGRNHLEARILHTLYAYNSHYAAVGAIWWWPRDSRLCVVDIDGTVTISDKRGLIASSFVGAARALGSALSGKGKGGRHDAAGGGAGRSDAEAAGSKKSGFGEALSHGYVHEGLSRLGSPTPLSSPTRFDHETLRPVGPARTRES
jgi:hypothetical protein